MNYIYDIVLNFNKKYYSFYEWNTTDDIINIRKIPIYRISENTYLDFKNYNICIEQEFIKKITNKTELYLTKTLPYFTCLVTSGKEVMSILIDKKGYIKGRSSLLFEEEDEAIELSTTLSETQIQYQKENKITKDKIVCRKEKERLNKLTKLIEDLQNYGNISALKYIYYDIFEKEIDDIDKIKKTIIKQMKNNYEVQEKLENMFLKN